MCFFIAAKPSASIHHQSSRDWHKDFIGLLSLVFLFLVWISCISYLIYGFHPPCLWKLYMTFSCILKMFFLSTSRVSCLLLIVYDLSFNAFKKCFKCFMCFLVDIYSCFFISCANSIFLAFFFMSLQTVHVLYIHRASYCFQFALVFP